MKPTVSLLSGLMLAAVLATPPLSYAGAQQNKMKTCNAEADAKGLSGEGKGDDRKAFMKTCLSAKAAKREGGASQQSKMKSCNVEATAKSLAGDERKAFMKTCLSS
ncbi:MAG TPA: PsiF family protein [Nitrospira sp.]|jgi:hypothetical protein|nr:PsiF family protein [Nitrospira sp.]